MRALAKERASGRAPTKESSLWASWTGGKQRVVLATSDTATLWSPSIVAASSASHNKSKSGGRMLLFLTVFCAFSRSWKTLPCKKWNATRAVWSPACASSSPAWSLLWWDPCTYLCLGLLFPFSFLKSWAPWSCNNASYFVIHLEGQLWVLVSLTLKFQNQEDSASSNPFALPNSVTPPLPTFARVTTAYGSYQDANIPFPRTSGARFCGAGRSFLFLWF